MLIRRIAIFLLLMILIPSGFAATVPSTIQANPNSFNATLTSLLKNMGYSIVPIYRKGKLFYVNGKAANQAVYFLLDTGSVTASLLSDGVQQLNLEPVQTEEKVANATGGVKNAQKVVLAPVNIGNIKIDKLPATVMEQSFKNNLPTVVLGNEFFTRYNAIIDINQGLLYLNPRTVSTQNRASIKKFLEAYRFQSVPLTKLCFGHFVLPVQINDAPAVYFLFDTGTSETTLSNAYVSHLKIQPVTDAKTQAATDGTITFAEINLEKIIFNPLKTFFAKPIELHNLRAASANVESLSAFLEVVGILGLMDMAKLHAIIDVPTQTVFLKT